MLKPNKIWPARLILCVLPLWLWVGLWETGLLDPTPVWADEKISAKLWVQDVLTMPKKPMTLKAHLSRTEPVERAGLEKEEVEFIVGGVSVGTAVTGDDGWAVLEYTTRMRGNLLLRAKVRESKRVQDVEATGTLFSWEHRRPILLIELNALMKQGPGRTTSKSGCSGPWVGRIPFLDHCPMLQRNWDD